MAINDFYRFSDFTLTNYQSILKFGLENYKFKFFNEKNEYNDKTIILRHDIEFSIPIALQMAEIEADLGIRSTYLLQLHGDFYNALEKNNLISIKRIIELGHQVGLHFDSHFWDIRSEEDLVKYLTIDKYTLEQYLNIKVLVFSFHNTNKLVLSFEEDKYAGLLNIYSKQIKNNIGYCADSTGFWRYEILEDRLRAAKDKVLQVLVHDGMWQDEVLPPRRRIYKVIDDHADFMKQSYDKTLKLFGAKNVDWKGEV